MANNKITVLVENTAGGRGLLAEHGLALWIELGDKKILFDTGQGQTLSGNAKLLNIALEQVDAIALSHGHYDHTGGLADVLRSAGPRPLYLHPEAFKPKFAQNADGTAREIGMPRPAQQMAYSLAELRYVEKPTELSPGLQLTGPVPRECACEDTGGAFYKDPACSQPDQLLDDQAAFIETPAGSVLILGCAHAGIINTLRYVKKLTNNRPIHTVIGGLHLQQASPERIDQTVTELRCCKVQRLLPCHCTGFAAMARLWNEFPGKTATGAVGTVIELKV